MSIWQSLAGSIECSLICADPAQALDGIAREGIMLRDVVSRGELELTFRVDRRDFGRIHRFCSRKGYDLKRQTVRGIYWDAAALGRRPVLAAGMAFLMAMVLWLPTRVLFFQVEGNHQIPEKQILEAAEECGIRFGISRRQIRSEKMKNALLSSLPQLQWAGINTSGCTAVISVRERQPESTLREEGVYSIAAACDGYITGCTVTAGTALCAPGQTVTAGQMLISPYTDCGLCIRYTGAEGEIYAQTRRKIRAVTPARGTVRLEIVSQERRYSLLLGKKRINLWKDSGISPVTCGRMYSEYYITLPGGFRLPVGLAVEECTQWETAPSDREEFSWEDLTEFARETVRCRMVAGRILREQTALKQEGSLRILEADFVCSEMISRKNRGKIGEIHEQSN